MVGRELRLDGIILGKLRARERSRSRLVFDEIQSDEPVRVENRASYSHGLNW